MRDVSGTTKTRLGLEDLRVNVRIKLATLWTAVMFCYIYADYFDLYAPGTLRSMQEGQGPIGPTTPETLLAASFVLAIPSLMIFLSVALSPAVARWLNVGFGAAYTGIILFTMWSRAFLIFYGVVEIALTLLVIWYAWKWPKALATS
jgi:hypothetical protein